MKSNSEIGWIYGIVGFVIVLFYFLDIHPKYHVLDDLHHKNIKLREQFYSYDKFIRERKNISSKQDVNVTHMIRVDDKAKVTAEFLATLLQAANFHGLFVQTIKPFSGQSISQIKTLKVSMVLSGSFLQFVDFIDTLSQHSLPIKMDYQLQSLQNGQVKIYVNLECFYLAGTQKNIRNLPHIPRSVIKINQKNKDPFVSEEKNVFKLTNEEDENISSLKFVSLNQLKLTGYMKINNHHYALVMLPNRKTFTLKKDMLIGKEQARVVRVNEESVAIRVDKSIIEWKYN